MATVLLAGSFAAGPSGWAQAGLTPPQIGFLRDRAQNVRPLLGISGTFWFGGAVASGVVSAASSGSATMLKTEDSLQVLDALGHPAGLAWTAPGRALFAFTPAGAPALAWLPDTLELLRWNGVRFEPTSASAANLNGSVVSVAAPDSSRAAFLVQRGRQLWRVDLSLFDGGVLFAANLPGASAPALLFDDGTLLYAGKSALVLRGPQGEERTIAFSGSAAQFTPMGRDWILVENSQRRGGLRGLRVSTGKLFELPEVAQ
jgi:hypothetical protein